MYTLLFFFIFSVLMPTAALSQTSAMVEKRIFSPADSAVLENQPAQKPELLLKSDSVQLTGVIVTPREKKAMFNLGEKPDKGSHRHVYKEGDKIGEQMTVQSIGPNYVMVNTNDGSVRIPLYGGKKVRPEAPVIAAAGTTEKSADAEGKPSQDSVQNQNPPDNGNPFGGGNKNGPDRKKLDRGPDPSGGVPNGKAPPGVVFGGPDSGGENNPAEIFKKLTQQNKQRQSGEEAGAARNKLMEMIGGSKQD